MNQKLYKGSSEGLRMLVEGYTDYAKEVVTNRAVPDIRDGLKPVQRRILWMAHKMKMKSQVVSVSVVGAVTPIHPHGDGAIYEAMVRMTDNSGFFNIPLFSGNGNFGKVYSADGAAASRYTKVRLNSFGQEFFTNPDGTEWMEDEMGTGVEPSALTVNYPYMLTVGGSGMAVGVSTKIPAFNFWDVLELTESYIKKGSLDESDLIYPDYTTGGHYIVDRAEAMRVMLTGRGRIKVRADVEIRGKEIVVNELPVGQTVQGLKKKVESIQANKDDRFSKKISSVYEATSYSTNEKAIITCRNVGVVEEVLVELYRRSILQTQTKTNIIAVKNKVPVIGGVFNIVKEWVEWRKSVIKTDYESQLEGLRNELPQLEYFIRLVDDKPSRDEFLSRLTNISTKSGLDYLSEVLQGIDQDSANWISSRRASSFLDGGKERTRYDNIVSSIEDYENRLKDLDGEILKDFASLRKSHAGKHTRRTQLTTTDYRFSKVTEERSSSSSKGTVLDNSPAVFTIFKDGMLRKTTSQIAEKGDPNVLNVVHGKSSDALIGFDNYGRILKLYGSDVPFHNGTESLYLPRYFDVTSEVTVPYFILYMGALDGSTKALLFRDGMMSFIDTSKWVNAKARHRIINKGVNEEVYDGLVDVIEEPDFPEVLVVHDTGREGKSRFSSIPMAEIRRPRGTRGRGRVFKGTGLDIAHWGGITTEEWETWLDVDNPARYIERVNSLPGNDYDRFNVDILDVLNEPEWPSQVDEEFEARGGVRSQDFDSGNDDEDEDED